MLPDGNERQVQPARNVNLRGSVIRDRFVLIDELDYGRLGTVYKAMDRQGVGSDGRDHHVALLLMPADVGRSRQALDFFKRDFVRLQALSHPNVVRVYDFDHDGELYYLTMEYLDGETLRSILDHLHADLLSEEEAFGVVRAIGDALVYAHARGIVHGDIRPENILVTGAHEVRVLFTSACLMRAAPFTLQLDSDVHGLGSIAYELFAGEPPFGSRYSTRPRGDGDPRRITTLGRAQWKALRTALMCWGDHPTSVSQFLAEFAPSASPKRVARPVAQPIARPAARPPGARPVEWNRGWLAVAIAWSIVILGAGYTLSREDSAVPITEDVIAEGNVVDAAPEPSGAEAPTGPIVQPITGAPATSAPNLDGRLPPEPGSLTESRIVPMPSQPSAEASLGPAPSVVTFGDRAITVAEGAGVAKVQIRRSGGMDPVSVIWWTSPGTARESDDYASFGQVVESFKAGEGSRTIQIPITSDKVLEGREFFRVHLRELPGGKAQLGDASQVTVTIVDDDF